MTKIALINCYFGKSWPSYFSHFLFSCKYNPDVDFILFTNLEAPFHIPNVHFVHIKDLTEFSALASKKLNLNINILDGYKLCDFKPTYGLIFQEYLKNYDFWGYCDIDIVFGNIRYFMTEKILQKYDVISPHKNYPAGFFTLLKNNEQCINLFKQSKDYARILENSRHFCFDECNFEFNRVHTTDITQINTEIESFTLVLRRLELQKEIKYYHKPIVQEFTYTDVVHHWVEGNIFNSITEKQYLLIHLINVKDNQFFFIDPFENKAKFSISPKGIHYKFSQYSHTLKKIKSRINENIRQTNYRFLLLKSKLLSYTQKEHVNFLEEQSYKIGKTHITFYPQDKNKLVIINEADYTLHYNQFSLYKIKDNKWIGISKKAISTIDFHYKNEEDIPYKISINNIQKRINENAYYIY
ncbi:DUF6625 family protein [Chryseobacterium rhizosphaerae]|jgi:hypothetical protein|uniref:Glycosyl transferase n=1 Tax=Chryseobacterium rhizosphaerae TaxID=395937 RepID=A0ABX9ING1_9FLAO|nr:DUF6625 family protein [Chryseobacterium rhizosphaerae]REC76577.1 hypothetical protein DRF57_07080 [Chryseobacterium rhizosphaerae]GEN66778.1 hypothetical protein CRH01_13460 [Chryseobacterium rhizosphaerae]